MHEWEDGRIGFTDAYTPRRIVLTCCDETNLLIEGEELSGSLADLGESVLHAPDLQTETNK